MGKKDNRPGQKITDGLLGEKTTAGAPAGPRPRVGIGVGSGAHVETEKLFYVGMYSGFFTYCQKSRCLNKCFDFAFFANDTEVTDHRDAAVLPVENDTQNWCWFNDTPHATDPP